MRGDDYPFVTNYCRYNWVLNLGMSQICMTKKKLRRAFGEITLKEISTLVINLCQQAD